LIVVLSFLGSYGNTEEPATKKRSPLEELKSEYEAATKEWEGKYSGKRTDPSEELIKRYDAWPGWSFNPRIVKLGTADPAAPDSFEALKWFVDLSGKVGAADKEYYQFDETVMKALRTHHVSNPRITDVFRTFSLRNARSRGPAAAKKERDDVGLPFLSERSSRKGLLGPFF
jgi:hypothetical protein